MKLTPELKIKILELTERDGANTQAIAADLQIDDIAVYEALSHKRDRFDWDVRSGAITKFEREPEAKPAAVIEDDGSGKLPMPDFAGYSVDRWFRVWGGKKQGRKAGPLTPFHYYKPDGTFMDGYHMSRDGERVKVSQATVAKQRHKAVRQRNNRSEVVL
jgi:hypothetical protein